MKDMASLQPGMSFYGEMPDSFTFTLNTDHKVVKRIISEASSAFTEKVKPISDKIDEANNHISEIRKKSELSDDEKKIISDNESKVNNLREEEDGIISEYAGNQPIIRQLVDIALLSNGMLKGEALSNFIKRSVDLL